MPLSTVIADKRKASRRNRPVRSRARALSQMPGTSIRGGHVAKRRKLRDQDSLYLGHCLYQCEDQGYHLDPDIHVGSRVPGTFNPFSILDSDITDPAEIPSDPPCELGSPCPGPMFPSTLYLDLAPSSVPAVKSEKAVFQRKRRAPEGSSTTDMPPSLSSTPTTPDATPRIKIPGAFGDASSNDGTPIPEYASYLDDVRIPSPLLYHRSSPDTIFDPSIENVAADLPKFELAYGQPKPEPDFTSYRGLSASCAELTVPSVESTQDSTFMAAKLPLMGSPSCKKPCTNSGDLSLSIPDARTSLNGFAYLHNDTETSALCQNTDRCDRLDIAGSYIRDVDLGEPEERSPPQSPVINFTHEFQSTATNLVFPKLHISVPFPARDIDPWNTSIVTPWTNDAANYLTPQNHKICIFTQLKRTPTITPQEVTQISRPMPTDGARVDGDQGHNRPSPGTFSSVTRRRCNGSTTPPKSKDLVPRNAYSINMLDWSGKLWSPKSVSNEMDLGSSSLGDSADDVEKIIVLIEWLKSVLVPSEHEQALQAEDDIFKFKALPEVINNPPVSECARPQPQFSRAEIVQPRPEWESEDEGYYTASELNIDAELLDANETQEEFSDWDWDWDSDLGEEEKIRLIAVE